MEHRRRVARISEELHTPVRLCEHDHEERLAQARDAMNSDSESEPPTPLELSVIEARFLCPVRSAICAHINGSKGPYYLLMEEMVACGIATAEELTEPQAQSQALLGQITQLDAEAAFAATPTIKSPYTKESVRAKQKVIAKQAEELRKTLLRILERRQRQTTLGA